MKKPLLLFVLLVSTIYSGYTQTIDAEYLNPKITANPNYKFLRFGGPSVDIPVMLTPHSGHTDPLRILVKKISY